jgi:hypothetical protein
VGRYVERKQKNWEGLELLKPELDLLKILNFQIPRTLDFIS